MSTVQCVAMAQGPTYRLRFFFDAGSGCCFWTANDAAREKHGYPLTAHELPLPENIRRQIDHLVYWYDTCIDWENPPGPSPWDWDECRRFNSAAYRLLKAVGEHLGTEYEITSEFTPVTPD